MTSEEVAVTIENMPLVIPTDATQEEIELMAIGHNQAKQWAAALVRDPSKPVILDD